MCFLNIAECGTCLAPTKDELEFFNFTWFLNFDFAINLFSMT